jgi:PKD repeat protein
MKRFIVLVFLSLLIACSSSEPPIVDEDTPPQQPAPTQPAPPPEKQPTVELEVSQTATKRGIRAIARVKDFDGQLTYTWSFGDGQTMSGSTFSRSHIYQRSGTFTVRVTVSSGDKMISTSKAIKVEHLRPANTPDVFIISFSGRCGAGVFCNPTMDNTAYLHQTKNSTLQVISNAFGESGHTRVDYFSFAGKLHETDSYPGHYGYIEARFLLEDVVTGLVSDYDNPTKLVIVGHSHGATWATLLTHDFPNVKFDYVIYLDGVCNHWDRDHKDYIIDFFRNIPEYRPRLISQYAQGCNSFLIGNDLYHAKDTVNSNVIYAIEVQSDDRLATLPDNNEVESQSLDPSWAVSDRFNNVRLDGLSTNIFTRRFYGEGHTTVVKYNSDAMNWVTQQIRQIEQIR